ncbi:MAG: plastocyanin/azurin family copper-binding protein [Thermoplasmata archaeon]|nr:plastocyanin/azurin family copper-binding protein [Thermoplasmata archaeon]
MIGRSFVQRLGWRSLGALVVGALVVLSAAGLSDGARPAPRASNHARATVSVTVTVGSAFAFAPSDFEVQPGDTVNFAFVGTDTQPHNFLLVAEANYSFPSGAGTSTLLSYFTHHPPLVNLTVGSSPVTVTATFTAPHLGVYEFVCTQSGHFASGMYGFMGSGVMVTNGQAYDGPGGPVFLIGGGIAGLVILAIVLAFVIGRRRGSHDEMPPERLGYPEPSQQPPKLP